MEPDTKLTVRVQRPISILRWVAYPGLDDEDGKMGED